MSAFNFSLQPSGYARTGFLLLAIMPPLLLAFSPITGGWLYLLALLAFVYYWQWYGSFVQLQQSAMLTLTGEGDLHWFGKENLAGQLVSGSLISQYAIKLCWRDKTNQLHQRWIFVDQCSESQLRTLARVINQHNWSSGRTKLT
ncbi:MAG TPA: protein YgfX [Rheinheimera sp.]|nr:protein YgfX [Rheinheimera sp.]